MAKAAMQTNFMMAPGVVSRATQVEKPGLRLSPMSRERETSRQVDHPVDFWACPAALTNSLSSEALPGPAIASHTKAAK